MIEDTWVPHPTVDEAVSLTVNLRLLRKKKGKLLEDREKILAAAECLQAQITEWEAIPGSEEGLNETLMDAQTKCACLKAWPVELDLEKDALLVQTSMEERDQQGDVL